MMNHLGFECPLHKIDVNVAMIPNLLLGLDAEDLGDRLRKEGDLGLT